MLLIVRWPGRAYARDAEPERRTYKYLSSPFTGWIDSVQYSHLLALLLTRKEDKYPLFINMSRQQYRNERARVLRKLIGKNFKTLLEYRGLTIRQVSEATRISVSRLKRLETGELEVRPSLLITLCDYFKVLIDCMAFQDLSKEQ